MRRPDARVWLVVAALAVFVAGVVLRTRVLEGRRQSLLGRRSDLPRILAHAADYTAARAAGERPRFIPGERTIALTDLPTRVAALSLGGLRGFLAIYLWVEAESAKNQRSHEDLLDRYYRIANLQSDYTSVWEFHSWNLAWNVSVQWASVERRYEWVRYGIEFLAEGIRRNPRSVNLLEAMGRIYYQRIAQNTRTEDREHFTAKVQQDDGAHPLRIAYKWYVLARQMQDETGESHATYSKKILHQQSCYAAHELAKELTYRALTVLADAARLQTDGQSDEAARRLAEGRDGLLVARTWWVRTVEEWGRQRAQYPDDFNAGLFGRGAWQAGREVETLLAHLTPAQLRSDPHSFAVRVNSAKGHRLLVAQNRYEEERPEEYHGP